MQRFVGINRGYFIQSETDAHVVLRQKLLAEELCETPLISPCHMIDANSLSNKTHTLIRDNLEINGFALIASSRPLEDQEFIEFCSGYGVPQPELDSSVKYFVTEEVILNIADVYLTCGDFRLQPFSRDMLLLHTEGSMKPEREQPRYIVLMCVHASDVHQTPKTVIKSSGQVIDQLSTSTKEVLRRTRVAGIDGLTNILRCERGKFVLSFRDPGENGIEWITDGKWSKTKVHEAFRDLLSVMYSMGCVSRIEWREGMIALIDNWRFLHGRTLCRASATEPTRHLKRIRLASRSKIKK